MPRISTDNYDTVASWNGSQDLFVVEQADGTKVATPEQVKQYVLGNSIDDIYSVMGQNGAKNLIPYPYYRASGYSVNGMTTTYDGDGVLTINKVAGTAAAHFKIANLNFLKPNTKYRLVFEVANATSINIYVQKPVSGDYATITDKSSGIFEAEFETTAESQITERSIAIWCSASDTETNATVKAMIVLASDTDDTYQPYAKTNKELTDEIGDLSQTGLAGDSVAEQLGDASGQITDISDNLTIVNNISPGPNINMLRGVYVKIGNLVSVCLVCRATGAITSDSVVCNVPANWQANAPLLLFVGGQLVSNSQCRIFNGAVRAGHAISSGTEFTIQGMYYSTN